MTIANHRTALSRLAVGVPALLLAGAGVLVSATPASAGLTSTPTRATVTTTLRAADSCQAAAPRGTDRRRVLTCVRDLAEPADTASNEEHDLFWLVLDCLSFGWSPESGFDDDAVNACLGNGGAL